MISASLTNTPTLQLSLYLPTHWLSFSPSSPKPHWLWPEITKDGKSCLQCAGVNWSGYLLLVFPHWNPSLNVSDFNSMYLHCKKPWVTNLIIHTVIIRTWAYHVYNSCFLVCFSIVLLTAHAHWWGLGGRCGSGSRAGCLLISFPQLRLHVKVFLGKILNPKLLPIAVPMVCVSVCEWLCKEVSWSTLDRKRRITPDEQVGALFYRCLFHYSVLWGKCSLGPLEDVFIAVLRVATGTNWQRGWVAAPYAALCIHPWIRVLYTPDSLCHDTFHTHVLRMNGIHVQSKHPYWVNDALILAFAATSVSLESSIHKMSSLDTEWLFYMKKIWCLSDVSMSAILSLIENNLALTNFKTS